MEKRFRIAACVSWTEFLVTVLWFVFSFLLPIPTVIFHLAVSARNVVPIWLWEPGIGWTELLSLGALALWLGGGRAQRSGAFLRVGFCLGTANLFWPFFVIVAQILFPWAPGSGRF